MALSGTCCTGKTTLINHFAQPRYHDQVLTIPEAARVFYATNDIPVTQRAYSDTQLALLHAYDEELKRGIADAIALDIPVILTDSSAVSCFAHAAIVGERKHLSRLVAQIVPLARQYAAFLLLDEAEVPYHYDPNDRIRRETPEQRRLIQRNIQLFLRQECMPYRIIYGGIQERIAAVSECIFNAPYK